MGACMSKHGLKTAAVAHNGSPEKVDNFAILRKKLRYPKSSESHDKKFSETAGSDAANPSTVKISPALDESKEQPKSASEFALQPLLAFLEDERSPETFCENGSAAYTVVPNQSMIAQHVDSEVLVRKNEVPCCDSVSSSALHESFHDLCAGSKKKDAEVFQEDSNQKSPTTTMTVQDPVVSSHENVKVEGCQRKPSPRRTSRPSFGEKDFLVLESSNPKQLSKLISTPESKFGSRILQPGEDSSSPAAESNTLLGSSAALIYSSCVVSNVDSSSLVDVTRAEVSGDCPNSEGNKGEAALLSGESGHHSDQFFDLFGSTLMMASVTEAFKETAQFQLDNATETESQHESPTPSLLVEDIEIQSGNIIEVAKSERLDVRNVSEEDLQRAVLSQDKVGLKDEAKISSLGEACFQGYQCPSEETKIDVLEELKVIVQGIGKEIGSPSFRIAGVSSCDLQTNSPEFGSHGEGSLPETAETAHLLSCSMYEGSEVEHTIVTIDEHHMPAVKLEMANEGGVASESVLNLSSTSVDGSDADNADIGPHNLSVGMMTELATDLKRKLVHQTEVISPRLCPPSAKKVKSFRQSDLNPSAHGNSSGQNSSSSNEIQVIELTPHLSSTECDLSPFSNKDFTDQQSLVKEAEAFDQVLCLPKNLVYSKAICCEDMKSPASGPRSSSSKRGTEPTVATCDVMFEIMSDTQKTVSDNLNDSVDVKKDLRQKFHAGVMMSSIVSSTSASSLAASAAITKLGASDNVSGEGMPPAISIASMKSGEDLSICLSPISENDGEIIEEPAEVEKRITIEEPPSKSQHEDDLVVGKDVFVALSQAKVLQDESPSSTWLTSLNGEVELERPDFAASILATPKQQMPQFSSIFSFVMPSKLEQESPEPPALSLEGFQFLFQGADRTEGVKDGFGKSLVQKVRESLPCSPSSSTSSTPKVSAPSTPLLRYPSSKSMGQSNFIALTAEEIAEIWGAFEQNHLL